MQWQQHADYESGQMFNQSYDSTIYIYQQQPVIILKYGKSAFTARVSRQQNFAAVFVCYFGFQTFSPMDFSPKRWIIRRLDDSPHGRFTAITFRVV